MVMTKLLLFFQLFSFEFFLQILSSWKESLPDDYTVSDFITEIQDWYDDGFLDDDVWKRLRKCISPAVLERVDNRKQEVADQSTLKPENVNTKPDLNAAKKKTSNTKIALTTMCPKGM